MELRLAQVKLTKSKSRAGYQDKDGQVFLPPLSEKRKIAWKKKMESKGFIFK